MLDAALGGDDDRAAAAAAAERALARRRQVKHVRACRGTRPPRRAAAPDAGGRHLGPRRRLCQRGVSRHTIGGAAASSLAPRRPIDPPPKRLTLAAVGGSVAARADAVAVRAQAEGDSFKKVVPFL